MAQALDRLTIKGFRSIRSLENFELKSLNVLIGGNGAGKTNFIEFFRFLRAMMELPLPDLNASNLQSYVMDYGGMSALLFNGPKVTEAIEAEMYFGENGYRFTLTPTRDDRALINHEERYFSGSSTPWLNWGSGQLRPELLTEKDKPGTRGPDSKSPGFYIYKAIENWKIYHLPDTSKYAAIRKSESSHDTAYLRPDASNIAPFLWAIKNDMWDIGHKEHYQAIVRSIRLVAPFFDDFILEESPQEKVSLLWKQKGSDYPLQHFHFSDGTLRFIGLATALLQPYLPSTLVIDEPELGLHPYAIEILAELIKSASQKTQLIISTQSPTLVDCFEADDLIVVNREQGASTFSRLSKSDLAEWLRDYSLGELWRKNVISAAPQYE